MAGGELGGEFRVLQDVNGGGLESVLAVAGDNYGLRTGDGEYHKKY